MDRFDRIYHLNKFLRGRRRPVSLARLMEEMECSRATIRRAIDDLRDYLGAPLDYDRNANGYQYNHSGDHPFELPGLWFNAEELYALLVTHRLLSDLQPGLLSDHLAPLQRRIEELLQHTQCGSPELGNRVRILQMAARPANLAHFRQVAGALLDRKRIKILYHGRERDKTTERIISPQRLIYYRSNWYLDAWCHLRKGLRSFSLDRMHPVAVLDEGSRAIPDDVLDEHYATAYGIFAGTPKETAVLRFTPSAARWVADEQWHPGQEGRVLPDGGYELRVPYSDPRELVMDILKHGTDVEVLAPVSLRGMVRDRLRAAAGQYEFS